MRSRPFMWILLFLLCLSGAWLLWRQHVNPQTRPSAPPKAAAPTAATVPPAPAASKILTPVYTNAVKSDLVLAGTNKFAFRLANTAKTIGQLAGDRHAILLENALIDTGSPLTFSIPKNLQSPGDPGAYIVQARGPIDNAFRAMLAAAGAQIVSYIPNDAYLVRAPAGVANGLAGNPLTQAVTPYEPYYKISSSMPVTAGQKSFSSAPVRTNRAAGPSLLVLAMKQAALPAGTYLTLGLFNDGAAATVAQIEKLGGRIVAREKSPFGPVVRVQPPQNWTALATLPGVQIVEPYHPRIHANDLSRAAVGVAADTQVSSNYLNLSGSNVLVQVNDSGIDATHPDLINRVFGSPTADTDGHGTHVAGTIAGNGSMSTTLTNVSGSIMPATNYQFRGMAPLATLLSMYWNDSDQELQEAAALANALISNNSWNNDGDTAYDLAAASYDAAVRDALPEMTGSQPVLFVFSAGNNGGGSDDGTGGNGDTILSPATAKNVITVGAVEQFRNITNLVTGYYGNTNPQAVWQGETSTGYSPFGNSVSAQVPGFSSRGNVGIGTEGTYGRFKPDVVAPGTFVVSTRSQQWDEQAYYNPTNYDYYFLSNEIVTPNSLNLFNISVPPNAVGVIITIGTNINSPFPFPTNLPIYVRQADFPTTNTYDFSTTYNEVSIPPDGGGTYLQNILNSGFYYGIGNTNNFTVNYDLTTLVIITNELGNYFEVLSNLNDSLDGDIPPHYYRYETGTSMAAADVSGVLALMEDYFTNQLALTPSPALLKAMLINGSRVTGNNNFAVTNSINFQGWGLIALPNSLPPGMTTNVNNATGESMLFLDQSPTNALATGDSHTYMVTLATNNYAQYLPLQVTLVWTDPPGDPVAAIKLVNNLDLVVTNFDDPANPIVFYGNDIAGDSTYNTPENATNAPNLDFINNVENVFVSPLLGVNYSITVIGRGVNVNAVTAQTNNVVQDYALVIACGEGEVTNAFTVTDSGIFSNPTGDQDITFVTTTNQPLLNQIVGASSPLLGTNSLPVGTNTIWGSNGVVTLGMTNQWHFYVVTNTGAADFTNAAFITFNSDTLAIPRMGVFADSTADSTRPEADIDLYVAGPNDPNASSLTNLDPMVISNCLAGANGDAASLSLGGTEYVVYTNSAPGDVYYIGVYSEDREASEFDFIPIFTNIPFTQAGPNGSQIVNGLNVPVTIPGGNKPHPGLAYVFAIALSPMEINRVVVTNVIAHQNFGDLIGTLAHGSSSGTAQSIVLNNHDFLANPPGPYALIYDDSGQGDIGGSQASDGPGSLNSFISQQAIGVWMLTEDEDSSYSHTGSVQNFTMMIEPHQDLTKGVGVLVTIAPGGWYYTYIDVTAGFTNLSIFATNLPPASIPPLQLYLNYDVQPNFTNYLEFVLLTNGVPPGNSISYGPPLLPGRYFVGLYNPDTVSHNAYLLAVLGGAASVIAPVDYTTNGPPLPDDAVSSSTIFISSTQQIASINVGFVVEHPRISDLTFTLVSPTGQRILLMENRGGTTTNGAGDIFITTNYFAPVTANGGGEPQTNYLDVGETSGSLTINYDMFTVPDQMTVYYGTNSSDFTTNNPNNALFNSGFVSYTGTATVIFGPGTSTYVTIIMNQFGNPAGADGTRWTYTAGGVQTNYNYLTFTEDTNLATIPIKFAIPPYTLADYGTNYILCNFELATNGDYLAPTNVFDDRGGWNLFSNQVVMVGTNLVILTNRVSVVADPANAADGSNFLALANGTISRQIPMTPGRQFSLTYLYRGPGIAGWWRGEGNATDSSDPENDGNNGSLIGRFNFPAGEVGQAFEFEDAGAEFEFAGTNTYVQIRQPPFLIQINTNSNPEITNSVTVQSSALDVGTGSGFTVEGWINPTNVSFQQPLVEWLARVPANGSDTNLVIEAGPFLNPGTGNYYYLLGSTNWTTSEIWATQLGGHLATIETANEENWVYDTFASYGGTNRNLWIGLTNNPSNPTNFGWSSGLTNVVYANWAAGQPTNCSGNDIYTAVLGQTNAFPGLWVLENNNGNDNNGVTCGVPPTNQIYGVVEVDEIQTNGVQLWISITNSPGTTNVLVSSNGCLYANLVDITNGSHEIFSAPGLVQSNVWQHVALTYSTNSGVANLYYNGTNVATTNLGVFVPKTTGDVLLGRDMSRATNNFYGGEMDEMSIYRRGLSASEIAAIYNVSALSTNRNIGKFDPSITPALSLAEAQVSFNGSTNVLLGANTNWQSQSFSFIATTNSLPLQITGMEPGMLLDSFSVAEAPLGNLYYLPEQSLDSLIGTSAYGTWTLEIWDNRTGAYITNSDQLISWQLQIVLQTNTLPAVALPPQETTTITVPPGLIVYLTVAVPIWANSATNLLVSATTPVDLLFNQTNPPTGSNPNDFTFLTGSTGGSYVMTTNGTPPLLPGQSYYLGVRNSGAHAVTVVVEVDYDITALTNGAPFSGVLTTNVTDVERYFAFDVTSSACEATFQLLQLSGNADLVVCKGTPLPTLTSSDYGSFNTGNADQNIYVLTNSSPVPLSAGRWYLGVFPLDPRPIQYAILAKELDTNPPPAIITLTNGVPFNFTAGPGAALTNFFLFIVTNTPPSVQFELYNLSGNGDLTVQTNAPPLAPPFFQTSQQPGRSPELIFMATNSALSGLTNSALTNLNAQWYLGVPSHEITNISFTILAVIGTNGYFPAFPGADGAGGGAAGGGGAPAGGGHGTNGAVYHVYNLYDSGPGSLRDAVSTTNRTVVFDVSGTINLLSPLVITNSYLTLAGQTAPGGCGITVAGNLTMVQSAHDVIIRDLRFRPAGVMTYRGVAWSDGFEGAATGDYTIGQTFVNGWTVITNQVTVITDTNLAYQGSNLLALAEGVISNTLPTVAGQAYNLTFAYRGPGAVGLWRGENNANDSIDGNNPIAVNNITYVSGEVGQAFHYDGSTSLITMPASTSLAVSNLTIDAWVYSTDSLTPRPVVEYGGGGQLSSIALWINTTGGGGTSSGGLQAYVRTQNSGYLQVVDANPVVALNQWTHLAFTVNATTLNGFLYCNGVQVGSAATIPVGSPVDPINFGIAPVNIGYRDVNSLDILGGYRFLGNLDEVSIYNRALSDSEIQAIYNLGSAGKYNPSAPSIAQGLAEAQVTLPGTNQPVFFGNDTNWQIATITFIATNNETPLLVTGLEPGMLLDAVSLTPNAAANVNADESLQFTNVVNVIADHISTAWSTNDLVSVLDSTNVTVQWSILADGLYSTNTTNNPQGCGSVLRYGYGALSFNHNLYANNYSANPYLDDNLSLDFVNNVIYNWGIHSGYSGTNNLLTKPNGFTNQLNYVCNYLIAGADTAFYSTNAAQTNIAFWGGTTNTWIYQTNNFIDSDTNGILNGADTEWNMFTNLYTPLGWPFPLPPVPTDEAFLAYEKVLDFAGVSLFARDWADADIVTGVRTQTGRIISTPPSSALVSWWPGEGNANDIVSTNNGIAYDITYTNGEVGQAFVFDGSSSLIRVPASSNLNVGLGSGFTLETWVNPALFTLNDGGYLPLPLFEWNSGSGSSDASVGVQFVIGINATPGNLGANLEDTSAGFHVITSATSIMTTNTFQQVALTYDKTTGLAVLYRNGVVVATNNLGVFTPQTSFDLYMGQRVAGPFAPFYFAGMLDEAKLYNRALSSNEIAAIYYAESGAKNPLCPGAPPLDSDQDGIPDYWEITFGTDPYVASNNQLSTNANYIGYTDLEEYLGWLAGPHALTVTNTPVGVDLYRLAGNTGNLAFFVTNAVNGTVYLTNVLGSVTNTGPFSNSIAVFTPAVNYSGYAAFDFFVTNNDTVAYFGPVTVSVVVSAVPVIYSSIVTLTNLIPYMDPTGTNGVDYYRYDVSTNATGVMFQVLNPTGPVVLLARYGLPLPRLGSYDYISANGGTSNQLILVWTNSTPVPLTSGWWYLAVSNASGGLVSYTMLVTELTNTAPTPPILPSVTDQTIVGGTTLLVTNTATDTNAGAVLVYTLVNPPDWATIDGNGIITLAPATNNAPTNAVITTIVTDTFTALSASNSFIVVVVTTNGLPAFPGAEGAGGFAIGGRGGDVYHVVNLNDSGPGSLRYGIQTTAGSRTIVFDVSGTINLLSKLNINKPYLTIAGQTAPGDGIAIEGWVTSVEDTHDVQVRFLRCRPGDINSPTFQDDSFHFVDVTNSIADHLSASWSIDEVLSTTLSTNITVQWCMIAEPLNHSAHYMDSGAPGFQAHGYGSLIRYGYGAVSYHHNLYADNYSRNPRPGDNLQLDFINNVVFNWGIFAGYNEDDSAYNPGGYTNFLNCIGNYYIAGSNTTANPNIAFQSGVPDPTFTQIYQSGNLIDNNPYGPLNGVNTGWGMFSGFYTPLGSQLVLPETPVTITNAPQAYEQVLAFAGASVAGASSSGTSLARDTVDTNIVTGVRYKSGQIIDFISSTSFPGVYLQTNFGVTCSGYAGAATYWTSQGFTNFVGANPWPQLNPAPLPVDTDQDGMPDYWEITLGMNPLVPNNNHPNPDGYTDLEHYLNWLAAPHALTVTNTPVAVDLYAVAGRSGNLGFSVANGTNGTVTLTNTIATFTPANNYSGFASFSFTVTNQDTANSFGPVTVSVMVSAVNIVTTGGLTPLTNGVPQTNSLPAGGFTYYAVTVPTNADFATNLLLFATAPVNVWFDTNFPPATNLLLLPDVAYPAGTNGSAVLSTNTAPPLAAGSTYYLGVQNTNSFTVTFALEVDFHLLTSTNVPASTNIFISSITPTNIGGKFGFLLQWSGPTNYQYEVQWTTNLAPAVWNTVLNPVINVVVTPTNGQYSFFDDGTLTGGFGPMKFYRVLGGLNLGPITGSGPATNTVLAGAMSQAVVAVPANAILASNVLLSATGPLNVWFNQTNPPIGNTNAGDFLMLSAATSGAFVLTSNSVPPLVPGTNYYLGFQNPGAGNVTFVFQVAFGFAPTNAVSNFSITATNGGIWLKWNGLTNYQYQVQWTTNLAPPAAWNTISNIVLTSTTGVFTFFDDGSLTGGFGPMKFYRLIAWPFMTPIPQTLSISSVTVTNIAGTNDLVLRWSAPTNYQYGIQWTTNVSLPFSNWSIIATPLFTLTNGVYTFVDNGQTGPPASAKFFRLLENP
ncbi:MAG: LamG-like jellyroll fold domain-containing protein [Verrucomicrobiia bacterium]